VIKALVFEPLGMEMSFYVLEEGEGNVATAWLTGETRCDVTWHEMPERAAAGLWTTPGDLLKVVRGLQRSLKGVDGDGGKKGFMDRDVARQMLTEMDSTMALTWFAPRNGHAFSHVAAISLVGNALSWDMRI
jgi:CubicO group peptidase (beta-lactamase class C family)